MNIRAGIAAKISVAQLDILRFVAMIARNKNVAEMLAGTLEVT